MKYLKKVVASLFLANVLVSLAWAVDAPEVCPAADEIKKAGLVGVQLDKKDELFIAYHMSKYNTSLAWVFVVGVPFDQAVSKDDAMNKAKQALETLSGTPTPVAFNKKNKRWYCEYSNQLNYLTLTLFPITVSDEMIQAAFSVNRLQGK